MARIRRTIVPIALSLAVAGCAGSQQNLEESAVAESASLEQLVDDVVSDADRRAEAKELLGELDRTIEIYAEEVRESYLAAVRADLDYDVAAEHLAVLHDQLAAARAARRDDVIALAMEARRILTAEEWKELSARRLADSGAEEGGTR